MAGNTPLSTACWKCDSDVVALLLEYGASVDVTDQLGYTPLMIASMKGSLECVRLLCESGANVNASNIHDGNTSLILTAVRRFDACSYLLLQHGADVEAVSLNGMTALATAAVTGNMRMSVYVGVCKMMNAWPWVWKVLMVVLYVCLWVFSPPAAADCC